MDRLDDVFLHQIAAPGLPGHISVAEAAAIRADIAELRDRPVIGRLIDVPDVAGEPAAEDVLAWDPAANGGAGAWVPGPPVGAIGGVYTLEDGTYRQVSTETTGLYAGTGLRARAGAGGAQTAVFEAAFGTSGTGTLVARDDHTHSQYLDTPWPIAPSGSLSSGTRPLGGTQISGLDPGRTYVVTARLRLDLRGEGSGAGRSTPRITLHGDTRARTPSARTVAGVDRTVTFEHEGVYVSGVTAVAFSASIQFSSGDPVYVDGGKLVASVRPYR